MTRQPIATRTVLVASGTRGAFVAQAAVRMVGALLAAGPFVGYLASRTVGVPGDPHDVGNWGYWVGTVSLVVEAALIELSIGMLVALRLHTSPERSRRSW